MAIKNLRFKRRPVQFAESPPTQPGDEIEMNRCVSACCPDLGYSPFHLQPFATSHPSLAHHPDGPPYCYSRGGSQLTSHVAPFPKSPLPSATLLRSATNRCSPDSAGEPVHTR